MKIRPAFVFWGSGFGSLLVFSFVLLVRLLGTPYANLPTEQFILSNPFFLLLWTLELILLLITLLFFNQLLVYKLPTRIRVAVFGFPRSGKTTLLTRLLTFNSNDIRIDLDKRTSDVIRPNEEKLESGNALASTTYQEVQPYIATIDFSGLLMHRIYQVEFGEFPGSETTEILTGEDWNKSPLYEWGKDAEIYIFIIDLGRYLLDNYGNLNIKTKSTYGPAYKKQIKQVWDYFKQDLGTSIISTKKVFIVFTKTDLLEAIKIVDLAERVKYIRSIGFGDVFPRSYQLELDEDLIEKQTAKIDSNFNDLKFFTNINSKRKNFSKLFVSCAATDKSGELFCIRELLTSLFE